MSVFSCGRSEKTMKCATDSTFLTFQVLVFITAYLATGELFCEIDPHRS